MIFEEFKVGVEVLKDYMVEVYLKPANKYIFQTNSYMIGDNKVYFAVRLENESNYDTSNCFLLSGNEHNSVLNIIVSGGSATLERRYERDFRRLVDEFIIRYPEAK